MPGDNCHIDMGWAAFEDSPRTGVVADTLLRIEVGAGVSDYTQVGDLPEEHIQCRSDLPPVEWIRSADSFRRGVLDLVYRISLCGIIIVRIHVYVLFHNN